MLRNRKCSSFHNYNSDRHVWHCLWRDRWKLTLKGFKQGCFGSPDYYSEVREILIDYILHNSRRFENHLPEELDEYIKKIMEDGEWDGEPEIVAFSEVYSIIIIVYDAMSCSTPYLIAENENVTHNVYLLMINNNHFNTFRVKGQTKSTDFQKVKKKD